MSMVQLEVSHISGMDLGAQAEVICNNSQGNLVVRTHEVRLKSVLPRELEDRG